MSQLCSLNSKILWDEKSCPVALLVALQNEGIRFHLDEPSPSMKILLSVYSWYISPQRTVFETSSLAYSNGLISAICAKRAISDAINGITSAAAYFFSRNFTVCGSMVRYHVLMVVFCDYFLAAECPVTHPLSTADADFS